MSTKPPSVMQVFDDYAAGRITSEEGARLLTPSRLNLDWAVIGAAIVVACLLLSACATVPRTAPDGRAISIHAGEPAQIDGVLLPVGLAAHLAQSETCCRDCLAELEAQGESVSPWLLVVVGVVAAGAGAAGGYAAGK